MSSVFLFAHVRADAALDVLPPLAQWPAGWARSQAPHRQDGDGRYDRGSPLSRVPVLAPGNLKTSPVDDPRLTCT